MDFLKALFEDKPLTFEELQAKLQDNKEIKLVNLASGNYVDKDKFDKAELKVGDLQGQLDTAKNALKEFEGVDVKDLKGEIEKLNTDLQAKDTEYQGKLADMEFNALLDGAISSTGARNTKAVKALLDMDTLKSSKNQSEDIKKALETVKTDNDYLFGSAEPINNPVRDTGNPNADSDPMASMRIAMGLSAKKE